VEEAKLWIKRIEARQEAQTRRFRTKHAAVSYKGGKCQLCSYNRSLRAFEFHHLDPNEKDFNVSDRMFSPWEIIKAELDKCMLVCANCHREIHDGLYPHIYSPGISDDPLESVDDPFTSDD
jgi:hypothetical protein